MALGITLNTKAGLGVSPIISVSYSASCIWNLNFGNTTLFLYGSFVLVEIALHTINHFRYQRNNKNSSKANPSKPQNLKMILLMDFLQLPLSLVFTRFLNIFSDQIPEFQEVYADSFAGSLIGKFLILIIAIILTGIGAALSLNMRIIPNPGDGIVQAISDTIKKNVGFTKNCFDLLCISVSILMGLLLTGNLIGIGLGTVLAVIGVGRVIFVFNHFCYQPMAEKAGIA